MHPAEAEKLVWDHERLYRVKGQVGNLKELDTIAPEVHPKIAELQAEVEALQAKLEADHTPLTHAVIDCGVWIDGNTPTVTWIDLRPGVPRDLPVFIKGNVANPGEIMLSATYQQASRHIESAAKADPTNRWRWRYTPHRLDIEAWRDAILKVSGELDLAMGGPSEPVDTECDARRTVYSKISRGRPPRTLCQE